MKKRSRKRDRQDDPPGLVTLQEQTADSMPTLHIQPGELTSDLGVYEPASLSQAKTYWFLGEWDKLVILDQKSIQHYPDRDRLALLVASAHQQLGANDQTRKYIRLAVEWGCPQSLVARILIAGIHNTLGKIYALKKDEKSTATHFRESVRIAADDGEVELLSHTRTLREMTRLGLLLEAASLLNEHMGKARDTQHRPQELAKHLLERSLTQWQFGDWESLAMLDCTILQHHPDRAILSLLAAAGRLQTGNDAEAKQFIRAAQQWGVSRKLLSHILIAGVYSSLGRAAAISNQQHRALQHFNNAISIGTPGSDINLHSQTRIGEQLKQIHLLRSGANLYLESEDKQLQQATESNITSDSDAIATSRSWVHDYWRTSQQEPLSYVYASEKRSLRLVEIFQQFIKPGRILEIGTNAGRNLHHLYATGYTNLVGIEINPAAVATLRNVYPELSDVPVHVGSVEDIIGAFTDKSFECVFTMAVLEHVHFDSDWIFAHIARIARCVITIEDELRSGKRHFPRNYERVFTNFGMRQIHMEDRSKWNLPTGFTARIFI